MTCQLIARRKLAHFVVHEPSAPPLAAAFRKEKPEPHLAPPNLDAQPPVRLVANCIVMLANCEFESHAEAAATGRGNVARN